MNTSVVNIKTDKKIKDQAQKIASDLGLTLSGMLNAYLRQVVRTKTVHFSLCDEVPNAKTRKILAQADKEFREGKYKSFDSVDDLIKSLNS